MNISFYFSFTLNIRDENRGITYSFGNVASYQIPHYLLHGEQ